MAGFSTSATVRPARQDVLARHAMPCALSSVSISGSTSSTTTSWSHCIGEGAAFEVGSGQERPSLSTGASGKALAHVHVGRAGGDEADPAVAARFQRR
jgi:hypothetical protein